MVRLSATSRVERFGDMAMVPAGNYFGWYAQWSGIDRNNQKSHKEWELRDEDFVDAASHTAALVTEWEALTQCETVSRTTVQRYVENAIVVPSAGERQTVAVVTMRLEGGDEKATLEIPAPVETLFLDLTGDNNLIVNTAHVGLNNFVDDFKTAGFASLSDGEIVKEILRGKKR